MSEEISVTIPAGGCTNCTECGLCGKVKKSNVITESRNAPEVGVDLERQHASVVAVDLGTTTIAMYRLDAETGKQLGVFVSLNPQQIHGADVLSRICAARDGNGAELQQLITETISNGVTKVAKEPPEFIVVAGNTVMQYLLLGHDPAELGVYPFHATKTMQQETRINGIRTIVMPGFSAFLGGDIVAGLYTLHFLEEQRRCMLIDLGTNGEMVIGNREGLLATSAAAGPAFDNKVYGTRLIAGISTLLKEGKMDTTGCLIDEYFESGAKVNGCLITQKDIRSIQQAKAAVRAGIEVLTQQYGCTLSAVDEVYLSGGFGFYLDLEAAFTIGLFPEEFKGKITVTGNTSLEGAYHYAVDLCDPNKKEAVKIKLQLIKTMTSQLNLAEQAEFEKHFIEEMNFPA